MLKTSFACAVLCIYELVHVHQPDIDISFTHYSPTGHNV